NAQFVIGRDAPARDELAAALLDWAVEVGGSFARARGVERTQLHADANELDADRGRLLRTAGYEMARTWLHMRRPVTADEATSLPAPREGTRVRPVHRHESGLPVSQDVRTVHRMLEESSPTTSTRTASPSPSSSSASSRTPTRPAGTTGGSRRSSAKGAGCPRAGWSPRWSRRPRPTGRAPTWSTS